MDAILREGNPLKPIPLDRTFCLLTLLLTTFVGSIAWAQDAKALPTVLPAEVSPGRVPIQVPLKVVYKFDAVPMDKDYTVFVHVRDEKGKTVTQADHAPPFPTKTSTWSGPTAYTRDLFVPDSLPDGTYSITIGLYDKAGRQKLKAGAGVEANKESNAFTIGTFTVDRSAPPPPLDTDGKKVTLDLTKYKVAWSEEFDGPLDVSPWGPGTRWIAHTPWAGDFGDARFADPKGDHPFKVKDGMLTISAVKDEKGKWSSGLLSSVDKNGAGFTQKYGYFEMRAKFPKGPGTWPAFWMVTVHNLQAKARGEESTIPNLEIDIVEQYGRAPQSLNAVMHIRRPKNAGHTAKGDAFFVAKMFEDFHTYGFEWDEKDMIWYFDGIELWRQPTPADCGHEPMCVLINLALGPGWPIDKTPNPSEMIVDYVRAYQKPERMTPAK